MKKTTIKSFARTEKLANRIFAATLGLTVFASAFTFQSCKDDDDDPEDPKITSISPAPALPGAQITITGQHFSKEAKNNTVNIGGESATVNSSTETSIITTVPATVTKVGPVDVYVTVEGRKSNVYNTFEIAEPEPDKPVLKTVDPTEAMPGDTIALTGEYLGAQDGATLTIGGETATIIEYSETAIKAQVPELEPGEAEIELSLKGFGPVKLPIKFMVKAKPISVEGFMPDSAGYGDMVTISGKNFGTEKGDITVMVNGKEQEVTEVTDGQVKIKLKAKTWSGDVVVIKGEQRDTADKKLAYKETYSLAPNAILTGNFAAFKYDTNNNKYYIADRSNRGIIIYDESFNSIDTIFKTNICTDIILRKNGELWATPNYINKVLRYIPSEKKEEEIQVNARFNCLAENNDGVLYLGSALDKKISSMTDGQNFVFSDFLTSHQPVEMVFQSNNLIAMNEVSMTTQSINQNKDISEWVNFESDFPKKHTYMSGGIILGHPVGNFTFYTDNDYLCKISDKNNYIDINEKYSLKFNDPIDAVINKSNDLIIISSEKGLYKIIIE